MTCNPIPVTHNPLAITRLVMGERRVGAGRGRGHGNFFGVARIGRLKWRTADTSECPPLSAPGGASAPPGQVKLHPNIGRDKPLSDRRPAMRTWERNGTCRVIAPPPRRGRRARYERRGQVPEPIATPLQCRQARDAHVWITLIR